jgi:HK97 gp10 family phage protein
MLGLQTKIVNSRMKELRKQAQAAAAKRNLDLAGEAEKIAKQLVAVDTGALKASIRVELNKRTGAATLAAGDEKVRYAAPQEYGSRFQSGTPFMTPAMNQAAKKMRNRMPRVYK